MKKFLAYACAIALILGSLQLPHTTAYAITVVSDAETAVEKNMELFLQKLDETTVDANFTKDDLENLLFEACEYSADKYTGTGFFVEKFKLVSPTSTKSGYMSAEVSIFQDDAEEAFEVKKEISLSGENGSISLDDGNNTSNYDNSNTADTTDAKKDIAAAKHAISQAIWDFDVSNDTTANDILNMAKTAVGSSNVTVTLDDGNFTLIKASTTVGGSLSATLSLACGGVEDAVSVGKTVPLAVTANSIAIDEDRHLVSEAISDIIFTNRTTEEDVLAVIKNAVKNGSEVSIKSFNKTKATFNENGDVIMYVTMTLAEESREIRSQDKIDMLVRNIPSDKISVNKEEWEIIRITNVERNKIGRHLLTMIEPLQQACNIREVELAESFSHTRPNGKNPFSAIENFQYSTGGENIYRCDSRTMAVSGERAMTSWMNSDGHRENLLKPGYTYIGTGTYDNEVTGTALQLFAGVPYYITSIVTASGKTNYIDEDEMQKDYLICSTENGLTSYVPLDISYMTKTDMGYTLDLYATNPIYLTVDGSNTADQAPQTAVGSFSDVHSTDYFADAVKWAVDRSITQGTSATTFSPDENCTRAQILTFLWRAVGSPKADAANPFADVSTNDYYYDAAIWAYQKGMVSGGSFDGDTPCTRASTVMYLWKNADSPAYDNTGKFTDVSANSEYSTAVAWAVANGVTSGVSDTEFAPDEICSRGQIVTFLKRALD